MARGGDTEVTGFIRQGNSCARFRQKNLGFVTGTYDQSLAGIGVARGLHYNHTVLPLSVKVNYAELVIRGISSTRLDTFRNPTDTGDIEALARYFHNVALCESLYPSINILEIAL